MATSRARATFSSSKVLHGDVQRIGREAGPFQKRQRQGGPERLMAQLVARHYKDATL